MQKELKQIIYTPDALSFKVELQSLIRNSLGVAFKKVHFKPFRTEKHTSINIKRSFWRIRQIGRIVRRIQGDKRGFFGEF
jgi:hypothetical protein